MTREEKEVALYCLKASSDYHSEVCEECIKYPNCDHTIQDDVTETIIKALEQEPCEDAVSRTEAIRLAEQGQIQGFEWQIRKLVTLPSVTPTQRWITVSERLPEESITVIGTTKFDDIYKTELYDDCGEKKWYANGVFDVPIVAWMPLPNPYKAEMESEE